MALHQESHVPPLSSTVLHPSQSPSPSPFGTTKRARAELRVHDEYVAYFAREPVPDACGRGERYPAPVKGRTPAKEADGD